MIVFEYCVCCALMCTYRWVAEGLNNRSAPKTNILISAFERRLKNVTTSRHNHWGYTHSLEVFFGYAAFLETNRRRHNCTATSRLVCNWSQWLFFLPGSRDFPLGPFPLQFVDFVFYYLRMWDYLSLELKDCSADLRRTIYLHVLHATIIPPNSAHRWYLWMQAIDCDTHQWSPNYSLDYTWDRPT